MSYGTAEQLTRMFYSDMLTSFDNVNNVEIVGDGNNSHQIHKTLCYELYVHLRGVFVIVLELV